MSYRLRRHTMLYEDEIQLSVFQIAVEIYIQVAMTECTKWLVNTIKSMPFIQILTQITLKQGELI